MNYTFIRLSGLAVVDLRVVNVTPSDQYILKGFDGLGPPEVDVSMVNTPHQGGYYQGSRAQLREAVVRIGLNPDWGSETVADMRNYLYHMLTGGYTGNKVAIMLLDDTDGLVEFARAYGYIKKFEINPFSKDPEVQITFSCESPYFQDQVRYEVDVDVINSGVRFDKSPTFTNIGNAPTGVRLRFDITDPSALIEDIVIGDQSGEHRMKFSFLPMLAELSGSEVDGGVFEIDTTPGNRYVNFWPEPHGSWWAYNLLGSIVGDITWLQLYGGSNTLQLSSDGATISDSSIGWLEISYMPTYWGI